MKELKQTTLLPYHYPSKELADKASLQLLAIFLHFNMRTQSYDSPYEGFQSQTYSLHYLFF